MKRIRIFATAALLALGLAGCSERPLDNPTPAPDGQSGYLAIRVDLEKQSATRGSTGQGASPTENDLKSVYLVTFDTNGGIVAIPEGGYYIKLDATQLAAAKASSVFTAKVSGGAKKIMAVANPGTQLLVALNSLNPGSNYGLFNAAIRSIAADEIQSAAAGFAMISCKSDAALKVNEVIGDALVDIDPVIVDGTTYKTDQAAIDAAKDKPVPMSIERLASKIVFKPVPAVGSGLEVLPAGAKFAFDKWTVDAVNETYFPFAKKTVLSTTYSGTGYKYNFYTEDLNYPDVAGGYHTGIAHATVNGTTKAPVLPWTTTEYPNGYYGWKNADTDAYLVENTMAAAAQRYGNATRIVIKGTYTPPGFAENADWFSYGGVNYKTLAELRADFNKTTASAELKAACEAFALQMGAADFASLTEIHLSAKAPYGGEFAKVPVSGIGIRYYQNGVNYWFYEIRHNSDAVGTMAYSKYGVVRNNWYNCTLNKVSKAGTPWYPDLVNPGDGDPDPKDPIDDAYGYIGIIITPQPWIVWENGMTI